MNKSNYLTFPMISMKCFVYALDWQTYKHSRRHTTVYSSTCVSCFFFALLLCFLFRCYLCGKGKQICDFIVFILFADICYLCSTRFDSAGRGRETQTLCNLVGCNLLLILMFKLRTARVIRLIYARRACKYATCKLIKRRGV